VTQFHHIVAFVKYVTVNYVTLFYDITLMNWPLVNLSLCLPIHRKLLLMCTCTTLSYLYNRRFEDIFQRFNPLEISDSKQGMHVLQWFA